MNFVKLNPSWGLAILRVLVSVLMLTHGYPKLVTLLGSAPIQFPDPIGIGATASLALTVFAEFLCSIFIIVGFKVRLVAIPPAVTMFVAAFIVHGADPLGKKEKALLFLISYVVLILCGGGKYSSRE